LAVGLCPDPLGELMDSPGSLAAIRGPTSKRRGRKGREGKGGSRRGCFSVCAYTFYAMTYASIYKVGTRLRVEYLLLAQ